METQNTRPHYSESKRGEDKYEYNTNIFILQRDIQNDLITVATTLGKPRIVGARYYKKYYNEWTRNNDGGILIN